MLVAAFLLFLLCQSSAEFAKVNSRCSLSSDNETTMTFTPASDRVEGRYTAELCSLKNPSVKSWSIDLSYYNSTYCSGPKSPLRTGTLHSTNTLDINDPTNCTHVCYSMNFDLIFSSCYGIKSTFVQNTTRCAPHDSYHLISNNLTTEYYSSIKTHVNFINHDYSVTLDWYLGIPVTDYRLVLCSNSNNTLLQEICYDVERGCAVRAAAALHCELAPPHGCYRATLEHEAPWTAGTFNAHRYVSFEFCHQPAEPPEVGGAGAGARVAWWACGAALAGCAALAAGAALARSLRAWSFHKNVLRSFRDRDIEVSPVVKPDGQPGLCPDSRPVLLLYAREGEHGQKAVAALKALIQKATGGQVYDLYCPAQAAAAGGAPAAWLRAVLWRDDVRVLLLQSPAAAALYHAQLCEHDAGLRLSQPLLPRAVLYRVPQFADALLQLALRLLAETAQEHHAYYKYYLATYSELQTDILPHVVPYRRYLLPGATSILVKDLSGEADADADLLQDFTHAANHMMHHVQDNPDYLLDELIIM